MRRLPQKSLNAARTQNFTYDEINRIKTAQSQATSGQHDWGLSFDYDIWGNLWSATITKGDDVPMLSQSFHNPANRIDGFCYDAAGNLLAQSAPPCPAPTYTYDAENRMTATAGVTYTYDGDGKRLKKTGGKLYWYGAGSNVMAESDLSGTLTDEYIFFDGKRIARRIVSSNTIQFYFADHLGTSRVVASATGTILDDSDFYPFGGERVVTSSSGNAFKFTGQIRDTESSLDYFVARYHDSAMGRFHSPDPFNILIEAENQNDFRGYISNPQNWNKFTYTWNNPLNLIDPDGERVFVVAYTEGNPTGDDEFYSVAVTMAREIRNSSDFDPEKDVVIVRGVASKDDFKQLVSDANALDGKYGKVQSLSLISHGGPADGPIFPKADQAGIRQFLGGKVELGNLKVNWSTGAEAKFLACNSALNFTQAFAHAQGVRTWGFDAFSSSSGRPDSKSKWYLLKTHVHPLYMVGQDGRAMVARYPQKRVR